MKEVEVLQLWTEGNLGWHCCLLAAVDDERAMAHLQHYVRDLEEKNEWLPPVRYKILKVTELRKVT